MGTSRRKSANASFTFCCLHLSRLFVKTFLTGFLPFLPVVLAGKYTSVKSHHQYMTKDAEKGNDVPKFDSNVCEPSYGMESPSVASELSFVQLKLSIGSLVLDWEATPYGHPFLCFGGRERGTHSCYSRLVSICGHLTRSLWRHCPTTAQTCRSKCSPSLLT